MPDPGRRQAPGHKVLLALVAVYLIWGSTYLAIRIAIETLPPFLMAGTRFLIAGAILYAITRPGAVAPTPVHWRTAALVGGLMLVGGNGLVTWAEQTVPSGLAALMVATVPLFLVLHGWSWGGDARPSLPAFIGLGIGFVGVGLLLGAGIPEREQIAPLGLVALAIAPICWSAGSILSRDAPSPPSPWLAVAMQMLAGGALLTLLGLATGEAGRLELAAVSARSLAAMAYLIVAGSIVALTAYLWLLKVERPAVVGTYAYVNPIVAVALGWGLANEPITARTLLAAGTILAGVILITLASDDRADRADARDEPSSGARADPQETQC